MRVSGVYVADKGNGDSGFTEPEVDAVADVAPVSAYEKWVEGNYTDWTTAWNKEVTGKDAIAANGLANGVNYVLGLSATETAEGATFSISGFVPGETFHDIMLVSNARIAANSGLVVKMAESLEGSVAWVQELPVVVSSVEGTDGKFVTTFRVSNRGKFLKLALETP